MNINQRIEEIVSISGKVNCDCEACNRFRKKQKKLLLDFVNEVVGEDEVDTSDPWAYPDGGNYHIFIKNKLNQQIRDKAKELLKSSIISSKFFNK